LRSKLGNRVYGCDDCLAVCPWNKFAQAGRVAKLQARADLVGPTLDDLARLSDAAFRTRFAGSPIKRIGRNRFVRNVLYAIGNSAQPALEPVAAGLCEDGDPVVADAARWAVGELRAK
jgi:epoxyqueuosine reductase